MDKSSQSVGREQEGSRAMATMVSEAVPASSFDGDVLVPPDGSVKLKDKTIPVVRQVNYRVVQHSGSRAQHSRAVRDTPRLP